VVGDGGATILVTGGAGYVGAHVARALAEAGHRLVTVDDLRRGTRDAVRWGAFVPARLDDREKIAAVLGAHPVSAVVHLAPLDELPPLLEALAAAGGCPLITGAPIHPDLVMPEVAWPAIHLRWARVDGAHPDGSMRAAPPPTLIARALAATGERPLPVATGHATPDGTAVRDVVHVWDLARAFVSAARHLLGGGAGETLMVGTGRGRSTREVVAAVECLTGRAVPVRERPNRGAPPAIVATYRPAERLLGWAPRYDLDHAITHVLDSLGE